MATKNLISIIFYFKREKCIVTRANIIEFNQEIKEIKFNYISTHNIYKTTTYNGVIFVVELDNTSFFLFPRACRGECVFSYYKLNNLRNRNQLSMFYECKTIIICMYIYIL